MKYEVLLYDLTSTYFESDPPEDEADKRRFGYSRDKRSDCVQVVIALIVTPEGFPLAYEVLSGNTADKTTLRAFLAKISAQYGQAERIWVMDRGIPTEEVLAEMRASDPPVHYLVGTPKGRLANSKPRSPSVLGKRCARGWRSSCCPRSQANSTSLPAAGRASTRSAPCACASSKASGGGSINSTRWS